MTNDVSFSIGKRSGTVALPIAPTGVQGVRFPKICSRLLFPEIGTLRWRAGMITLNEWKLSGTRIAHLGVRVEGGLADRRLGATRPKIRH